MLPFFKAFIKGLKKYCLNSSTELQRTVFSPRNEGQFICVATDRLKRWIESGKHIAKDSALLTCKHGQLSLDKMDTGTKAETLLIDGLHFPTNLYTIRVETDRRN